MTEKKKFAPEISKLEFDEMKTWFDNFDKNGDKKLDKEELKSVFTAKCWKISDEEFAELFKKFDSNGDGTFDFGEYTKMCESFRKDPYVEKMEMLRDLRGLDPEGKGTVAKRHILNYLSDHDIPNLNDMMKKADKESNGKINVEAFVDLLLGS